MYVTSKIQVGLRQRSRTFGRRPTTFGWWPFGHRRLVAGTGNLGSYQSSFYFIKALL